MVYSAVLLSLFITMILVPVLRRLAGKMQALDLPNERKVHAVPMPKTGGLAMAAGMMIPIVMWSPPAPLVPPLLLASGVIVSFGFLDDLKDLGFRIKFAAQIVAAIIVVYFGQVKISSLGALLPEGMLLPGVVAGVLTVFVIVGVTNAINLADGLDGLAGGISLLTFLCLGYLAWQAGRTELVLVAASMSGALFGFLRFNTHPATVFMGDAGSQLLGFLAITLALGITQESTYSPLLPLVLLGFPVFDTIRVMSERARQGKSPFKADRNHFHHKLLGLGLCHSEAVLVIYLCQGTLTLAAYLFRFHSDWLLLGGYLVFSAANVAFLVLAGKLGWFQRTQGDTPSYWERFNRRWETTAMGPQVTFAGLGWLLAGLTAMHLFLPQVIPSWVGWLALCGCFSLAAGHVMAPGYQGVVMRTLLYAAAPYLIYTVQIQAVDGFELQLLKISHLGFLFLGLMAVLVIKLTRRKRYQPTPLDFLILVIALVVPCFPVFQIDRTALIVVATKILVLFFGFEVYLVEKRREFGRLQWLVMVALVILGFRAFSPMVF